MRNGSLLPVLFLLFSPLPKASAQERTEGGHLMQWTRTIQERSDERLPNGRYALTGWSFIAFECSANEAMKHWKKYMEGLGGAVKGNDPTRCSGAVIPGLTQPATLVFAAAEKDKEAGGVRVRVAFALNESTAVPADAGHGAAVHAMAVQVNRAVVEEQIADQEKRHAGIVKELEAARKEEAKATDRAAGAGKDLEKVNKKQSKLAKKQADLQKEVGKLQQRYAEKQDPKDLEKLSKAQGELAKVQKDAARMQKEESDAQEHMNKHQGQVPDAQEHQRKHEKEKDQALMELEALKRKLEAIR